jgi:uncharacterized protein
MRYQGRLRPLPAAGGCGYDARLCFHEPVNMTPTDTPDLLARLERIADALERLAPPAPKPVEPDSAEAFVWHPDGDLAPVAAVNRIDIGLLKGIDRLRDTLVENTERFARGLPANNALLWGARGMGKSSLVKAVHALVNSQEGGNGSSWSRSTARTSRRCRG